MTLDTKKITELPEESVPLVDTDLGVVVVDLSGTPTTKKSPLSLWRRYVLGIATVGIVALPEATLTLGTAAAAGTDTVATSHTTVGPLSRGAGAPAALVFQVGVTGISSGSLQTPTEVLRLQEMNLNGTRLVAGMNPNGPLMGGVPLNVSPLVFVNTEGVVAGNVLTVVRAAVAANITMSRVNGSLQVPSVLLSADVIGQFSANGFDGTQMRQAARVQIIAEENWTTTALGSSILFAARPIGSATARDVLKMSATSASVGNLISPLATLRLIVGATAFAFRDSTDASDIFTLNGTGTAAAFPVATAFTIGTDPGGGALFRAGGSGLFNGVLSVTAGATTNAFVVTTTGAIQAAFRYDASNRLDVAVGSTGATTLTANGTSSAFTFVTTNATINTLTLGSNSGPTARALLRTDTGSIYVDSFYNNGAANNRAVRVNLTQGFKVGFYDDSFAPGTDVYEITRFGTDAQSQIWRLRNDSSATYEWRSGSSTVRLSLASTDLRPRVPLVMGADASGTNVAATPVAFRGPASTGNATPAGFTWQLTAIGSSGSTVQSGYATGMSLAYESAGLARLTITGILNASQEVMVGSSRVLSVRQASVADATGAGDIVAQFNDLLTRLRVTGGHGLIAD